MAVEKATAIIKKNIPISVFLEAIKEIISALKIKEKSKLRETL